MTSLRSVLLVILSAFLVGACDSGPGVGPETNPDASSIGDYLAGLNYDAGALLNVQPSDAARTAVDTTTTTERDGNVERVCTRTTYNLENNFEEIAILRPTADVIWPGSLVEANQLLLDGLPEPARFDRSPVKIRVDLPGIGANGTKTIERPDEANVQTAIDEALEWWNANAYEEGYVNASSSSNRITTSYSSTQASMDVGLNVAWATGDVQSQFNYETSAERRVVMSTYKQAFYTVSFVQESGAQPEDVFGPDVTLTDVQSAFDSNTPPAYVASVTYGRIIMFRMETESSYTSAEVEAAFKYAAGTQVDADLEARYEEILSRSTVEVITLGGNAAVASEAVTARSAGDLEPIITGENAVYSRSNPGVPISYAVKYLKDDRLAKLGYTTEYTATECSSTQTRNTVTMTLDRFFVRKDCDGGLNGPGEFSFRAIVQNGPTREKDISRSGDLSDGQSISLNEEVVFEGNRVPGYQFALTFYSTERDRDISGRVFNDSRMDNRRAVKRHEFTSSGWTNLNGGARIALVNGSGDCRAELFYSVTVI
ncbi:thiol-activated cytolysin family protein [Salinibacter ruber]|uniref:thiol-activated cytolysin family protein n=1 Tax=Salinibacter ruber TaxID=146919 RepID=UPI002167305F|nr:thiol-activated cytolysin family protein [Salinibacter ruber]MCS4221623.1 thiol-activated cytolysin [Salinibacter ruber]